MVTSADGMNPEQNSLAKASADPYDLRIAPHALGIRVQVRGEGTYENTIAYWQAIVAEVRKRRPKCLLLIDEMHGPPL